MVGWKPFSKKSASERRSNISPEICLISRAPNRRAEWELKYSLYSVHQALPSCGAAAGIPEQGGPISFNNLLRYYSCTRKCSILRCTVQWLLYFTELSKDHHYPIIQYFHHHPINVAVVRSPSCAWLCDPMDGSTPDLPVPHHLPEFAQVHAHYISDAVQPSHPLSPLLLLPSIFPSIRNFSSESSVHIKWPKYWNFSISVYSPSTEYSGLISLKIDRFDLLAVQGTFRSLLQHHSLKLSILWHSAFFMVQLSQLPSIPKTPFRSYPFLPSLSPASGNH